jgi:hypothetical protein
MPRPPKICNTPLKKFVCTQCSQKFRSKAGRKRHINAKHWHSASGLEMPVNSPRLGSEEAPFSDSDISSCHGLPSTPPGLRVFDSISPSDTTFPVDFGVFGAGPGSDDFSHAGSIDRDDTPPGPLSPSRDSDCDITMASSSTEYHPYINGK